MGGRTSRRDYFWFPFSHRRADRRRNYPCSGSSVPAVQVTSSSASRTVRSSGFWKEPRKSSRGPSRRVGKWKSCIMVMGLQRTTSKMKTEICSSGTCNLKISVHVVLCECVVTNVSSPCTSIRLPLSEMAMSFKGNYVVHHARVSIPKC